MKSLKYGKLTVFAGYIVKCMTICITQNVFYFIYYVANTPDPPASLSLEF